MDAKGMNAAIESNLRLKIIPFSEWRLQIAPLWLMTGSYHFIHQVPDSYGQMQYVGRELFTRVILFPIAAELEGERVGWTSVYNISDDAVSVRGIYVLPECRSSGIGVTMVNYAMSLWPSPWHRCFMYARSSNVQRYERWGFTVVPGHQLRAFELADREALNERGLRLMMKSMRPA